VEKFAENAPIAPYFSTNTSNFVRKLVGGWSALSIPTLAALVGYYQWRGEVSVNDRVRSSKKGMGLRI
jgi:hypothetical protein